MGNRTARRARAYLRTVETARKQRPRVVVGVCRQMVGDEEVMECRGDMIRTLKGKVVCAGCGYEE